MSEDKMSPEFALPAPAPPAKTARRKWSAIELNEIRQELSNEFDKLSKIKASDGNGFAKRTSDFQKDAGEVVIERAVTEAKGEPKLGFGLMEPQAKPQGA